MCRQLEKRHSMKRALITGGTGFVGANLARRLLADGCDVHLLVRPEFQDWRIRSVQDDLRLWTVAVEDADGVGGAVAAIKPDAVFHLAAHGAYPHQTDRCAMFETNVLGTRNVVNAGLAAVVGSLVVAGSSSEYGRRSEAHRESDEPHPESDYARTKAAATAWCSWNARECGASITTLRLYSVYGPWEEPTRLIPRLLVEGRQGRRPPLADPATARDFVHVDDAVEAFLLAAAVSHPGVGAVYNVGTGQQTTLADAVRATDELFGTKSEPEWASMSDRSWDTSAWVADNRLIRDQLGWKPIVAFNEGLRKTLDWYESESAVHAHYEAAE